MQAVMVVTVDRMPAICQPLLTSTRDNLYMNPEVGLFAGLLAWVLAVAVAGLAAARLFAMGTPTAAGDADPATTRARHGLIAASQQAQTLCVLIATGSLAGAFLTDDFSVAYVAEMSTSALPAAWAIDAMLSGMPGIGLVTAALFSIAGLALSLRPPSPAPGRWVAAIGSSAAASALALGLTAWIQMPFARLVPAAAEGQGAALARRVAQGYELAPTADAASGWVMLPSLQLLLPIVAGIAIWGLVWAWWVGRSSARLHLAAQP
jgi:hypothetical protein